MNVESKVKRLQEDIDSQGGRCAQDCLKAQEPGVAVEDRVGAPAEVIP